jgi:hypothetical protein
MMPRPGPGWCGRLRVVRGGVDTVFWSVTFDTVSTPPSENALWSVQCGGPSGADLAVMCDEALNSFRAAGDRRGQ